MSRYSRKGSGGGPAAFAITSFTHAPALVQVGRAVVNPSFTASYNRAPVTAVLTDTEAHTDDVILTPNAFSSPHSFTKNVYSQSVTFTLTATEANSSNANTSITWGQNVYYGVAVDPGSYSQAFIKSLTAQLKLAPQGFYAVNAGAGESTFFASRTAFGLVDTDFFVGVFGFAISKVAAAVAVTNSDGITENYDLWRSDNVGLGLFTFEVA